MRIMEHHAYVFFADSLETATVPLQYKTQSVDVIHLRSERFSIDDARELTRSSQLQAFEGDIRVFVIITNDIALEAQNALLKLFEEPPLHAQFYLVLKKTALLLPTLRSRLSVGDMQHAHDPDEENLHFTSFASASHAERIARIADKTKEKDTAWIEDIVRGCEVYTTKSSGHKTAMLKATLFVRTYIGAKGSSAKMLLEELALTLPLA